VLERVSFLEFSDGEADSLNRRYQVFFFGVLRSCTVCEKWHWCSIVSGHLVMCSTKTHYIPVHTDRHLVQGGLFQTERLHAFHKPALHCASC
jgi:hypothetical protein